MTIWIRRGGAVLLGVAFAAVLAFILAMQAVNATLARPAFFPDQLQQADVYQFVIDDLLTALLEDTRRLDAAEFNWEFEENPLAASGLTTRQITDAVHRALPPDDFEALVAPVVEQLWEYVAGERDEVTLVIDAEAHLDALVRELTDLMRESGAYARLLDDELTPIFAEWVDEEFPPADEDSEWMEFLRGEGGDAGGSLVRVFTRVVTPEWIAGQVERAGDEFVAYLAGSSDGFELRIELDDTQAREAAGEIEAVIAEADAFDVSYATVVEPVAEERVAEATTLPYGVVLNRAEVLDALRDSVSEAWLDEQASILAGDVAAYLTGGTDAFVAVFDTRPVKGSTARALTATAAAALRERLQLLLECSTAAEVQAARVALRSELPPCIPSDVAVAGILDVALPAIAAAVDDSVLGPVPDLVSYSEQDFRDALEREGGEQALLALDDVRNVFAESWTYTDADLRTDLAGDEDALDLIENLRALLSTGYVIETSDESREGVVEALDMAREAAGFGRAGVWIGGLVAAVLLAAVAFLGGRSWRGRVAWAAGVLLVSAGVIWVVSWPVFQSESSPVFDTAREELAADPDSRFPRSSDLLVDKLLEIAEAAADEAAGGIARTSLILAVIAAVVFAGSLLWSRIAVAAGHGET